MNTPLDNWKENLRLSFKPEKIKVLYIGESAPVGGTFFYTADSILFSAIHQSFKSSSQAAGMVKSF